MASSREGETVGVVQKNSKSEGHLCQSTGKSSSPSNSSRALQEREHHEVMLSASEPVMEVDKKIVLEGNAAESTETTPDVAEINEGLHPTVAHLELTLDFDHDKKRPTDFARRDVTSSQTIGLAVPDPIQRPAGSPKVFDTSSSDQLAKKSIKAESTLNDSSSLDSLLHQPQGLDEGLAFSQPSKREAAMKAEAHFAESTDGENEREDEHDQTGSDGEYIGGSAPRKSTRKPSEAAKKRDSASAGMEVKAPVAKKNKGGEKNPPMAAKSPKQTLLRKGDTTHGTSQSRPEVLSKPSVKVLLAAKQTTPKDSQPKTVPVAPSKPRSYAKPVKASTATAKDKTGITPDVKLIFKPSKSTPDFPKSFKCECNTRIQKSFADFNVPDDMVASRISGLLDATEEIFIKIMLVPARQQQLTDNLHACCLHLTTQLTGATNLMLWGNEPVRLEEACPRLMVCLSSSNGTYAPAPWEILQSIFWAFVTDEVFADGDLLRKIGFKEEDLKTANSARNVYRDLDESDPREAKVQRMVWRQYLARQLQSAAIAKKVTALSTHLSKHFFAGMICFSNSENPIWHGQLAKTLITNLEGAIRLRAELLLSSFRYKFSWVKTGSRFQSGRMNTDHKPCNGLPTHLNRVRIAKSPLIEVQRPKGDNKAGLEAVEIPNDGFDDIIVLKPAKVLCFDGRIADQPGDGDV